MSVCIPFYQCNVSLPLLVCSTFLWATKVVCLDKSVVLGWRAIFHYDIYILCEVSATRFFVLVSYVCLSNYSGGGCKLSHFSQTSSLHNFFFFFFLLIQSSMVPHKCANKMQSRQHNLGVWGKCRCWYLSRYSMIDNMPVLCSWKQQYQLLIVLILFCCFLCQVF